MQRLSAFLRRDAGNAAIELILVLPMLIWAYLALFAFWDAYRAINVTQKSSYAIADMISRFDAVDPADFVGMQDVLEYMIGDQEGASLRITAVAWNEAQKRFDVKWSRSPGNARTAWTTASLNADADTRGKIPTLADGEWSVLVETWADYEPPFDLSALPISTPLEPQTNYQFIATRPRPGKTCLTGVPCT